MNPPAFERSLTVRTPNPWLLALSFVPFALAATALLYGLVSGDATALAIPHLTIFGAVAVAHVLKRRPFARYATEFVRADGEGLRVGADLTPKGAITRALFVPLSIGELPLVRIERRRHLAIELVVRDESEAQQLLAAIGHDVSRAKVTFSARSPLLASWARYAIVPAAILGVALNAFVTSVLPGAVPLPLLALLAFMVAYAVPARVEVGADGVLVRWLGTRRFFAARDLAFTERYEGGFGRNRHVGVRLHLEGAPAYNVIVGSARWAEDDAAAFAERVDEVIAAHRRGAVVSAETLARRGRPVPEWIRALRALGVGADANFRRAELDREALWQVYESPTSTPDERAAAAVALSAEATPETAQRIRVTVDALAEPTLREAITAASGDDETLVRTLTALDEAKRAKTPE